MLKVHNKFITVLSRDGDFCSWRCNICSKEFNCKYSEYENFKVLSCGCHKAKTKPQIEINGQTLLEFIFDCHYLVKSSCGHLGVRADYTIKSSSNTKCYKCARIEVSKCLFKHGRSKKDKTYSTWLSMKRRCDNIKQTDSKDYLLRGISVCDRWANCFENFLQDMGEKPEGLSLERLDVNKGYEPSNCIWADNKTQQNNKTNNILIEHFGEVMSLKHWCDLKGIQYKTAHAHFRYKGYTIEQILGRDYQLVDSKNS